MAKFGGRVDPAVDLAQASPRLERWERTVCCTGYSVAFHALRPVLLARALARAPAPLNEEQRDLLAQSINEVTRSRVLGLLEAPPLPGGGLPEVPPPQPSPAPTSAAPEPSKTKIKKKLPARSGAASKRPGTRAANKAPGTKKAKRAAPAPAPAPAPTPTASASAADNDTRAASPPLLGPAVDAAVYDTIVYKYFRDPASGKFELFCGKITERGTDEGGDYVNIHLVYGRRLGVHVARGVRRASPRSAEP